MITTEEEAYEAILAHHAALDEDVKRRVRLIVGADESESDNSAVAELIKYLNAEVVPHAISEEHTIYQVASDKLGLTDLIAEMTSEHRTLVGEIKALENSSNSKDAAEHSERFSALFSKHVAKENDLILPKLLGSQDVDLRLVLSEMHELFEAAKESSALSGSEKSDPAASLLVLLLDSTKELARSGQRDLASRLTASAWAVLEHERPDLANRATAALHRLIDLRNSEPVTLSANRNANVDKELDVRTLAPAQRHAEIFAAYRALSPGRGFLLINDHDPKPLQYQFEAEYRGQFTWDYLEGGPKVWRVRIGRPS